MNIDTIFNTPNLTNDEIQGKTLINPEKHNALMNEAHALLEFFNYDNDPEVDQDHEYFAQLVRNQLFDLMKNIKNIYFELHSKRKH